MTNPRPAYDCDTSAYWCPDSAYQDAKASFGQFIEAGRAYHIFRPDTPRPWLNYLSNEKFASCVSNTGLGFTWLHTSLLRVTKYDHEVDYLPREFRDGREICLRDEETGAEWPAFRQAPDCQCVHRPGLSRIEAAKEGIRVVLELFVPLHDPGECWIIRLLNESGRPRRLTVSAGQTWSFSHFGIHTAEEGIPYLSTPGRYTRLWTEAGAIFAETPAQDIPLPLYGLFLSAEEATAMVSWDIGERTDGRVFKFPVCRLERSLHLDAAGSATMHLFSGADSDPAFLLQGRDKFADPAVFEVERRHVLADRSQLEQAISCTIPDKNIQIFLNTWLKNQLHLTFRFVRSGYVGFRDTLQDAWGYTLLDPAAARRNLLRTLAHVRTDGVCPRNYSVIDNTHDLRAFMDSGSWIAQALVDYVKETGDFGLLREPIPWLDSQKKAPLLEHAQRALDLLYEKRGRYGLCLTGDGDWNDALEGISKSGKAVSAWLTMAVYHAQNLMAELYGHLREDSLASELQRRSKELRDALNQNAWDGQWYVYGFTGSGSPIGSSRNREGRIHLNAQTWALFSGLADEERAATIRRSIRDHLETKYGPALLAPPYVEEAAEVGRIARLEPGTFENGSIYMHAVAFAIYADFIGGHADEAADLFARLLPTNPENFDARRTCEPYCTGNYYCGPGHQRFGQNFFTWFTGNAAWLLRAGFDRMLGMQADFDGLRIKPSIPSHWDSLEARRTFRGQQYHVAFKRVERGESPSVAVEGRVLPAMWIPSPDTPTAEALRVDVRY